MLVMDASELRVHNVSLARALLVGLRADPAVSGRAVADLLRNFGLPESASIEDSLLAYIGPAL